LLAMIFCLWLWTQAVYVINTLCLYCMVVWAVTIPAAILILIRNVALDLIKVTPRTKMIVTTAAWPTIIVVYLVIYASILLRFDEAIFYDKSGREKIQRHAPTGAHPPVCGDEASCLGHYVASGRQPP